MMLARHAVAVYMYKSAFTLLNVHICKVVDRKSCFYPIRRSQPDQSGAEEDPDVHCDQLCDLLEQKSGTTITVEFTFYFLYVDPF